MAAYSYRCPVHGVIEIKMTYAEHDSFGGTCPMLKSGRVRGKPCARPLERYMAADGAPVAIFNGPGFTRRSTFPDANRGIDHSDWRGGEYWPGDPKRKADRPKVSGWTGDDFRRRGV